MALQSDRSLSEILQNIGGNVQEIVRSEIRLAKAEAKEELTKSAKAGSSLASGAALALYALGFLLLAVTFALEIVLPAWLSALIVSAAVGAIAAALISSGIKKMRRVSPTPEKTIGSVKENVQWARDRMK